MDRRDKTAIENLIIISNYMLENSILSDNDESLLRKSISRAQNLIGVPPQGDVEDIILGDIKNIDVKSYLQAIKSRKKSWFSSWFMVAYINASII